MTDDTLLPFDLPSVCRKKVTVDFNGGNNLPTGGGRRRLRRGHPLSVWCRPVDRFRPLIGTPSIANGVPARLAVERG